MTIKLGVRTWMVSVSALVLGAAIGGRAWAQSFDVAGQPLEFNGSGTGSGVAVGSQRSYTGVITIDGQRIDATVTLVELNKATLDNFDSTANPYAETKFFQPNVNFSGAGGYGVFRFDFFADGKPVTLQNFYVNTYDLDGAGSSSSGRQFTDFGGFASYALSTGTKVTASPIAGGYSLSDHSWGKPNLRCQYGSV